METEVFDIVREAITIAKVQRVTSVPRLREMLLVQEHSHEDIQSAFNLIANQITPLAVGTHT